MASRLELQSKLEGILGNRHVYYQPAENLKMEYPAIRYSKSIISGRHADNMKYTNLTAYEIIVISRDPDISAIDEILDFPYSSHQRRYVSDNLYHDVINLYY